MRGVVFVAIHQRLRELGDEELRRACFPETCLAFRDYPDAELVRIAKAVAEHVPAVNQSVSDVLRSLGEEVIATLAASTPGIVPTVGSLAELLGLLGEPDPRLVLPNMRVERETDGRAELIHLGDASVCRFDEGLLIGLAQIAGQKIAMRHPSCRSRRDRACIFMPRVVTGESAGRRVSKTFRFERPEDGG